MLLTIPHQNIHGACRGPYGPTRGQIPLTAAETVLLYLPLLVHYGKWFFLYQEYFLFNGPRRVKSVHPSIVADHVSANPRVSLSDRSEYVWELA